MYHAPVPGPASERARPTSGKDLHNALYQTVHVMPPRTSDLADLHTDVDAVLAIALVKQPEARWRSVGELREALAEALVASSAPARADGPRTSSRTIPGAPCARS